MSDEHMNILFIGGVFSLENEQEVIENTHGYIEFSANVFQKRLINGFIKNGEKIDVLSAPLIGAYPFGYKKSRFNGFRASQNYCQYVDFINIWGLRHFSRTNALRKAIRRLCKKKAYDLIIVYSAHEPFLNAGIYTKVLCPRAKLCYVVPDLPQYMNLNAKRSRMYDFFKKIDIKRIEKHSIQVDSFVILTEPMKDILHIGRRPYIVVEGIIEAVPTSYRAKPRNTKKLIAYTGKMNECFGIINLIDTFTSMQDPDCMLILCGDGDAKDYILEKAAYDLRIHFLGQVTPDIAGDIIQNADVLVNPRTNDREYTKYSFPSKTLEYLQSGKPVVTYMLSGYAPCYAKFLYIVDNGLEEALCRALYSSESEKAEKRALANEHLKSLVNTAVVSRIIKMNQNDEVVI